MFGSSCSFIDSCFHVSNPVVCYSHIPETSFFENWMQFNPKQIDLCHVNATRAHGSPDKIYSLRLSHGHCHYWEGRVARLKWKEISIQWISLCMRNTKIHFPLSQLHTSAPEAIPTSYSLLHCLALNIHLVPQHPAWTLCSRPCPWTLSSPPQPVLVVLPNLECFPFSTALQILFFSQGSAPVPPTSSFKLFLMIPAHVRFLLSELLLHLSTPQNEQFLVNSIFCCTVSHMYILPFQCNGSQGGSHDHIFITLSHHVLKNTCWFIWKVTWKKTYTKLTFYPTSDSCLFSTRIWF